MKTARPPYSSAVWAKPPRPPNIHEPRRSSIMALIAEDRMPPKNK